ncbi:DUF4402 domain-containing protein [Algoriphagus sp. C2-6-M1]|uniref:DUF4402 domain-containing protein n=1 Tax=Algoriphagus persicinus TaxID=3108754 RepID=UPI002B385280|nr:DUF4402 domain-containing protein [Algoriphagus sp. C2-6-M1]MEB2780501.1 DUF4402 domain-containing protein [Algoriphagus sp. C2-6-M1]
MTYKQYAKRKLTFRPSGFLSFWKFILFIFASVLPIVSEAQIQVYQESPLNFGDMILSETSGTVTINPAGDRTATGNIILLNNSEINPLILSVEAPYGSNIQIQFGTEQLLYGSNGGQLGLTLNASNPVSPFTSLATPPQRTTIYIGGTLSLGTRSTTPAGVYSGSVTLVFIQE